MKYKYVLSCSLSHTLCSPTDIPDNPMETELDASSLPFGLPHPLLQKQLVSLTGDRHLQVHSYLMEFSESLYVLGDLAQAIQWSLTEAVSTLFNSYRHEDSCTVEESIGKQRKGEGYGGSRKREGYGGSRKGEGYGRSRKREGYRRLRKREGYGD